MKLNTKSMVAVILAASMLTGCSANSSENISSAFSTAASSEIVTSVWVASDTDSDISETESDSLSTEITDDDLTLVSFIPEQQPEAADDFYSYVNYDKARGVLARDNVTSYSAFTELDDTVKEQLSSMFTEINTMTEEPKKGTCRQKIKDLYASAMNDGRNSSLKENLDKLLKNVMDASDVQEYVEASAALYKKYQLDGCMTITPEINSNDTSSYQANISTLYLPLPEEYFTDDSYAAYQTEYLDLITDLFEIYGYQEAEEKAQSVYDFQKEMANAVISAEDDDSRTLSEKELSSLYSNIDTAKWLKAAGCENLSEWNALHVSQAKAMNAFLTGKNLQTLKDYTLLICMYQTASCASTEIRDRVLTFNNNLNGDNTIPTEDELALSLTEELLPWEVSDLYVKDYVSAETKSYVSSITSEITDMYKTLIGKTKGISSSAKKTAITKLNKMNVKIGYPDDFADYLSEAVITSPDEGGTLWENMLSVRKAAAKKEAEKFGTATDRSLWDITPFTVNAYYNASRNELVIPAAILQEPFFSASYAREQILGGIGFVAAHEITHVFDENGSSYDENGNYSAWWTKTEKEKYNTLKDKISSYYSKFKLLSDKKVNGELTAAEDIADLSGLECICRILSDDSSKLPAMFEQFASCWIKISTKMSVTYALENDTHAPAKVRVNAPLRCLDSFYKAYDVTDKSSMYLPENKRITIW